MIELKQNDKISIYGNLKIKSISKRKEENICIAIENKEVKDIIEIFYNLIDKQFAKYNYDWTDIKSELKTTKLIVNGESIMPNYIVTIRGYIHEEMFDDFDFSIPKICIEDIFEKIQNVCDFYIYDFDTVKDALKFVIKTIEIEK